MHTLRAEGTSPEQVARMLGVRPAVVAPVVRAIDYARGLGFEPASDFAAAAGHLGPFTGSSAIRFGHDGKPLFVQGPHDDGARIIRKLEQAVGADNFHFIMALPNLRRARAVVADVRASARASPGANVHLDHVDRRNPSRRTSTPSQPRLVGQVGTV